MDLGHRKPPSLRRRLCLPPPVTVRAPRNPHRPSKSTDGTSPGKLSPGNSPLWWAGAGDPAHHRGPVPQDQAEPGPRGGRRCREDGDRRGIRPTGRTRGGAAPAPGNTGPRRTALLAGRGGELFRRVRETDEGPSRGSEPGRIILFIDEVHSIIGAGGSRGSSDFASLLKPALARGEMACIAATTSEEYRAYIEPDAALERRFQPVYVSELTPQQTLLVLADLGKELERLRGVRVGEEVREWLVRFADQFLRNRRFPTRQWTYWSNVSPTPPPRGRPNWRWGRRRPSPQRLVGMPLDPQTRLDTSVRACGTRPTNG